MSWCSEASISDAAFVHLAGIHTLDMSWCSHGQVSISDAALVHLAGIRSLDMSRCSQAAIMDGAFAYRAGIHTLEMSLCSQATIMAAWLRAPPAGGHPLPAHGGGGEAGQPRQRRQGDARVGSLHAAGGPQLPRGE